MNLAPMDKSARFLRYESRHDTDIGVNAMRWNYLARQRGPLRHCVFTVQPIEQGNSVNGYERIPLIRTSIASVLAKAESRLWKCEFLPRTLQVEFYSELSSQLLLFAVICETFIASKFAWSRFLFHFTTNTHTDLNLSNSVFEILLERHPIWSFTNKISGDIKRDLIIHSERANLF